MKNLKFTIPFCALYMFTFIPLFWPLELLRLIPYAIMLYLLTSATKKVIANSVIVNTIFAVGVFFDVAPFFSSLPFITTIAMVSCLGMVTFSEGRENNELTVA